MPEQNHPTDDRRAPPAPAARVTLAHGSGGRAMDGLLDDVFAPFAAARRPRQDGAHIAGGELVVSTDAFVVTPTEFPGGSLGKLAVCGTVNDVAAAGGRPRWLTSAFVLEEGLDMALLHRTVEAMQAAADEAGVEIVAGDTKVVERGAADGLFVVTTGIGERIPELSVGSDRARPGDKIIVSGTMGDHGIAVMAARARLPLDPPMESDCASLVGLVEELAGEVGPHLRCLRDPTRGGLAATLNEIAEDSQVPMLVREADIPVTPTVRSACDLLGLDPLQAANEGKMLLIVSADACEKALATIKANCFGRGAALIGTVGDPTDGAAVWLEGDFAGRRRLEPPRGELLPRIC